MSASGYSQADRPIRLKTTLGETELLIESFSGTEAVSQPFEFFVSMTSENPSVDIKSLLQTVAVVYLRLADGSERPFNGVFRSLRQHEMSQDNLTSYEGTIVPKLWFLTLNSDCRIFQNKTVPEIVEAVLRENGVTDLRFATTGTYQPREYCVQYRETQFNFISRLLEEEGIFYYFEHTETAHTVVFSDNSQSLKPCPGRTNASYAGMAAPAGQDSVAMMAYEQQAFTGKVTLADYNFEKPNPGLLTLTSPGVNDFEYSDYPGEYATVDEGDRYVKIRAEELESRQAVIRGAGTCRAFSAGYRFTLQDHYRRDLNKAYVLLSVSHVAQGNSYQAAGRGAAFSYNNSFEAIPQATPFRPPRHTPKPVVQGAQTAVVVGKAGEEIWVDKYGRIRVQFFWDRLGKNDEQSSCWIRVSQIWAGKQWGWITLPRMGQEVIVDFLEGDPDRPIITGRIYNADQMPPYSLPDNQTMSGIITRTSKSGDATKCNEIHFEDMAGKEEVYLHAEKDMNTSVENDDTQTVQNDRTITVDGKHTETVTKDTAITIKEGNHSLTIQQGDQSTEIKMGRQSTELGQGSQFTKIKMGNETFNIDMGKSEKEAMQSIELKVGQSSIKLDQTGVTIKGLTISIQGQISVEVKGVMTQVNGDAMLTLKGGITMIN